MNFLNLFKHLLPRAKAWKIVTDKPLRKFWDSLTIIGEDYKNYADTVIFDDRFPYKTTKLDEWLEEFGLFLSESLTEAEKRDILAAVFAETGGQSPSYLTNRFQDAGFEVYTYGWWLPGWNVLCGTDIAFCGEPEAQCGQTNPDIHFGEPNVKNPLDYIRRTFLPKTFLGPQCGEELAQCGEPSAFCGNREDEKTGYPLVNLIELSYPKYTTECGEPSSQCGEPSAECGAFVDIIIEKKDYSVPDDENSWRKFMYIGGKPFGTLATIPSSRRDEFERLALKICPSHLWIGVLVKYV